MFSDKYGQHRDLEGEATDTISKMETDSGEGKGRNKLGWRSWNQVKSMLPETKGIGKCTLLQPYGPRGGEVRYM